MKILTLRVEASCVRSSPAPALRKCSDWNVRFAEDIFRFIVKNAKHFKCCKDVLS